MGMAQVKLEMGPFPSIDLAVSKCWDGPVLGTASPHARNTSGLLLWHLHGGSSPLLYWFFVQKQCSVLLLPPPARYKHAVQQGASVFQANFPPLISGINVPIGGKTYFQLYNNLNRQLQRPPQDFIIYCQSKSEHKNSLLSFLRTRSHDV